jgi:UDP-glucose:(glucosyl)LPS alpha-1,2-glucosyltransferase
MSLQIIDDTETVELGKAPSEDGTYTQAMGGTELMNKALVERVDSALLDEFHIIKSRVRKVDTNKKNILWLHDLWADPEAKHLSDPESRKRFTKLVFVSNWQLSTYNMGLGVPYAESTVLRNAIEPIAVDWNEKPDDVINIIYHTTPHRGLDIVYAAVEKLAEMYGNKIHLDVFSSFKAYGWEERDQPYLQLFDNIRNHPQMTYHGFQPNDTVREYLQKAHIFAYPSTWQETSCIAAIEAMSAGCEVVCSNLAALPETTGHWADMYDFNEDIQQHANVFVNRLYGAIERRRDDNMQKKLVLQKNWVDNYYNWDLRAAEWTNLLTSLR